MDSNGLVPMTAQEEAAADDLLTALSDLAYAAPSALQVVDSKRKYKSRFFFTLSKSFAAEVTDRARAVKPKEVAHIDHEVEQRLADYKKEVPSELEANIAQVREFFLTQIGPKTLAGGAGAGQAREIVQRLLSTEIDSSQFDRFDRMSALAVNMAMARFVAAYYNLPAKAAASILEAMQPRPPSVVPIPHLYERPQQPEVRRKAPDDKKP